MLITLVSEKGGAGKTSLAALLAERFLALGLPVRCADGDRQASLAALCEQAEGRLPGCQEVFPRSFAKLAREDAIVILDLPSGASDEMAAALSVADVALVPVVPNAFDLRTIPVTLGQVARAQELRRGRPKALLVANKIDEREASSRALLQEIKAFGWPVARTVLHERSAFKRVGAKGLGALPRSTRRGAEAEAAALASEVMAFAGIKEVACV